MRRFFRRHGQPIVIAACTVLVGLVLCWVIWSVATVQERNGRLEGAVSTLATQVEDLGGTPNVDIPLPERGERGQEGEKGEPGEAGAGATATDIALGVSSYFGAHPELRGIPGATGDPGAPGRAPTQAEIAGEVSSYFADHPELRGEAGVPTDAQVAAAVGSYFFSHPELRGEAGPPPSSEQVAGEVASYFLAHPEIKGDPGPAGPPGPEGPVGLTPLTLECDRPPGNGNVLECRVLTWRDASGQVVTTP